MTSSIPISAALLRNVASRSYDLSLAAAYETGQAHTKQASAGVSKPFLRYASQFISSAGRVRPRSPDREASRRRRRMLGGSSDMPSGMRHCYTEGERAALSVIAGEVKKHGVCDLAIDRIAAVAGVSRTSVQNALRKAKRADHRHLSVEARPRPGRKNLTNVIRVISKEWMAWLKRSIGFKSLRPTKTKDENISLNRTNGEFGASGKRALELENAASIQCIHAPPYEGSKNILARNVFGTDPAVPGGGLRL